MSGSFKIYVLNREYSLLIGGPESLQRTCRLLDLRIDNERLLFAAMVQIKNATGRVDYIYTNRIPEIQQSYPEVLVQKERRNIKIQDYRTQTKVRPKVAKLCTVARSQKEITPAGLEMVDAIEDYARRHYGHVSDGQFQQLETFSKFDHLLALARTLLDEAGLSDKQKAWLKKIVEKKTKFINPQQGNYITKLAAKGENKKGKRKKKKNETKKDQNLVRENYMELSEERWTAAERRDYENFERLCFERAEEAYKEDEKRGVILNPGLTRAEADQLLEEQKEHDRLWAERNAKFNPEEEQKRIETVFAEMKERDKKRLVEQLVEHIKEAYTTKEMPVYDAAAEQFLRSGGLSKQDIKTVLKEGNGVYWRVQEMMITTLGIKDQFLLPLDPTLEKFSSVVI